MVALSVAIGVIVLLALIVHPTLGWCAVFLVPFLAIEWWQARRTRPTTTIPDFRPADQVDDPT